MPTATVKYTPEQEKVLQRELTKQNSATEGMNKWRKDQTPPQDPLPVLTLEQLVQQAFETTLQQYANTQHELDKAGLGAAFQSAKPSVQEQVKHLLGYNA